LELIEEAELLYPNQIVEIKSEIDELLKVFTTTKNNFKNSKN